jgi:ribonuclease Z
MMDVCLLGCGGMMPLKDRWLTSLLVRHNGRMILIDCGEGTQIPLKQAGWGVRSIDAICLTHYHADHVAGLPGILFLLANSGREDPLVIIGPPGLEAVLRGLTVIAPQLPYDIYLIELSEEKSDVKVNSQKIGEMIIHSLFVDHAIHCLSYAIEIERPGKFDPSKAQANKVPMKIWNRLQKGETIELDGMVFNPEMILGESRRGLKVSYSTDTRPTSNHTDFIRQSDLFICEGMYGDNNMLQKAIDKKHMLFSEAAELAKDGDVKELWLTHFSPAMGRPEDFLENAREIFPNTHLGNDLMTKALHFQDK